MATKERHHASCEDYPSLERMSHKKGFSGKVRRGPCGKKRFSLEEAKEVVKVAKFRRTLTSMDGQQTKRRETRWYYCSSCVAHHTSSKPDKFSVELGDTYELAS
jgi:hypothetical protein